MTAYWDVSSLFWISQKPSLTVILLHIKRKNHVVDSSLTASTKLDKITLRNHAARSYITWLPIDTIDTIIYNMQLENVKGADFENSQQEFGKLWAQCMITGIIIHQRFLLARNWSKRVTWANIPQLKYLMDYNTCHYTLCPQYAKLLLWIFKISALDVF